jgi:protein-disulfide isomerase
MKNGIFLATFVLSVVALSGCQTQANVGNQNIGNLGTYNSSKLAFSDLDTQERNELFEAQKSTYDTAKKILEGRYLNAWFVDYQVKNKFKDLAEAKNDFYAKNASVSEVEVKNFIKENASNPQMKQIPKNEQETVVRQYLSRVAHAKAEQSILKEAENSGKITVTAFSLPKSPQVHFNAGGYVYDSKLKNPKVTIVEFADYQCPFCVQANSEIEKILEEKSYQGKVQYIFRDFPLTDKHAQAMPAAIAAKCAANQGQYWGMHKALFDRGMSKDLSSEMYTQFAKDLKLDLEAFDSCQKDPAQKAAVEADFAEGVKAGVNGTPMIYINGEKFEDSISFEALKKQIDKKLADS